MRTRGGIFTVLFYYLDLIRLENTNIVSEYAKKGGTNVWSFQPLIVWSFNHRPHPLPADAPTLGQIEPFSVIPRLKCQFALLYNLEYNKSVAKLSRSLPQTSRDIDRNTDQPTIIQYRCPNAALRVHSGTASL